LTGWNGSARPVLVEPGAGRIQRRGYAGAAAGRDHLHRQCAA
jgi:hypothetical protein